MLLTLDDQKRLDVIQMIMNGSIGIAEGGRLLGKSDRQVHRIVARVGSEGWRGVIHKNRGKRPRNKGDEHVWKRVMKKVREKYLDINDRHLQEILEREEGIRVGRESLR